MKCCAVLSTILRYLSADQAKRPRPFYIGVTTVFILVTVMTMFKSVIDSSPILFVKIGQEQVGAIDFTLTPTLSTSMISANINYYAIDQFHNPLAVKDPQKKSFG